VNMSAAWTVAAPVMASAAAARRVFMSFLAKFTTGYGVACGGSGAICTFSPFARFTGGCNITLSPLLTPALTSTWVP
jgi:hypothetical protein